CAPVLPRERGAPPEFWSGRRTDARLRPVRRSKTVTVPSGAATWGSPEPPKVTRAKKFELSLRVMAVPAAGFAAAFSSGAAGAAFTAFTVFAAAFAAGAGPVYLFSGW